MKLVELTRQAGDGHADVVAAVGPLEDAEADTYATALLHLIEQHADPDFSVGTTPVESTSGATAEPPAGPAELLRAVLSGDEGRREGEHDLPQPDPRP
ncbi:hypothetical protein [Geodermatophilus ruber]|uniref:Uncharacterized protein n=1 Tax=Geodermatophilus ruber TaxID=504800 RepID=A0A1I4CEL4_9ACTN|nr:hypothetical protein [Geodermatophilus ruber]SFK79614.1 hypothetical protein SAMN04488085_103471 [Geodermatophilus ruber]